MSKTWYPVIDYEICLECGICTDKCCQGVYDMKKAPTPVVAAPENCLHGCHGCGRLCPSGAITYVGDTNAADNPCDCSCENTGGCCG